MASIRIADSLKYGAKLFAFFLLVALVGGGMMVLGAALVVPELQTYLDGGSVSTTSLASGALLAVLGTVAWISGTFAVAYKLIGDAVADGLRAGQLSAATPAAAGAGEDAAAGEESSEELGPSPGEQAAEEHGAGQTVPGAAEESATEPEPPQPATEEPTAEPAQPEADQPAQAAGQPAHDQQPAADAGPAAEANEPAGPRREGSDQPVETAASQEPAGQPAESKPEEGRERTAEEIAFGTSGDREESAAAGPDQSNAERVAADDGSGVDDFEADVEEDVDPDETLADQEENVEPANKTGADPLADFDEG